MLRKLCNSSFRPLSRSIPLSRAVREVFDFTPAAIIRDLGLRRPIYRRLAAYGHMGREDLGVRWEDCDKVEALRAAAGV